MAAARLHPSAAVGYYGNRIGNYAGEKLTALVMLRFGKQDAHIPAEEVKKVHAVPREVGIFWYEPGHDFNCDALGSYNPEAAHEARRSPRFLKKDLA